MMGERLQAMGEMAAAVETFYGQLTPEQQKKFDQGPMMMGGRHARRGF
jgi:Spy/CpxP family protein refolding chaperone